MPRILIADDDHDIRDLVATKLRRAGYDVVTAIDGAEALRALEGSRVDLAVLDIMMPGLSGLDVVREVRAREGLADLPLILLTARAEEADIERGFAAGATDYVTKPFSPRALLARIASRLGP